MLSNSTIPWPCKHEEHHGNTEEWNANTQPDRAAERSKESKKCWWNFLRRIVQDRNTFTNQYLSKQNQSLCMSFLYRLKRDKRQIPLKSLFSTNWWTLLPVCLWISRQSREKKQPTPKLRNLTYSPPSTELNFNSLVLLVCRLHKYLTQTHSIVTVNHTLKSLSNSTDYKAVLT